MKCPHCHHGDLFKNKNPYDLRHLSEMYEACPVCGCSYFPEPGFYWGAMYMSYALTVGSSFVNVLLFIALFGFRLYPLLTANTLMLLVGFPLFFRYARVLWLQLNTPFSKEAFLLRAKKEH